MTFLNVVSSIRLFCSCCAMTRSLNTLGSFTKQDEPQQLIDILNEIANEPSVFKERVIAQQEQNNRIEETNLRTPLQNKKLLSKSRLFVSLHSSQKLYYPHLMI
jgi:hypothetical protein